MQSKTMTNSITLFGEVYSDGVPVMVAMQLKPKGKEGRILNIIKISSAYENSKAQGLIDSSDILYIDANKNRTDTWLRALGLQLPSGLTEYGSISNVTYYEDVVNNENVGKDAMAKALEQAIGGKKQFSLSDVENSLGESDITSHIGSWEIKGNDITFEAPTAEDIATSQEVLLPFKITYF